MKLHILGSSSSGNCYLFTSSTGEVLILEAGVRLPEIKKALDFDLSKVVGCLVTHEHGDHAKSAKDLAGAGIDIYTSVGTIEAIKINSHRMHPVKHGENFNVGSFRIKPFNIKHDCAQPFGYLINHPEMGTTLFVTDSYYLEYKFSGLNNLLVECNYDENILAEREQNGDIHPSVSRRVRSSHMELSTLKSMLLANDLVHVNNIVLIHLSSANSDAKRFQQEISELTRCETTVAVKNLTIPFNKTAF